MSALTWMADSSHISWRSFDTFTWVIFAAMALFVAWTIWRAVHLTVHPGEREGSHIKRQILQDPAALAVAVSSGATTSESGATEA